MLIGKLNKELLGIEVWNSPNGDGEWHLVLMHKKHGWIAGKSLPVDAGILAIVPKDAIENTRMIVDNDDIKSLKDLGMLFNTNPILETSHHLVGYVQLNGEEEDFVIYCDNCGDYLDSEYDIVYKVIVVVVKVVILASRNAKIVTRG